MVVQVGKCQKILFPCSDQFNSSTVSYPMVFSLPYSPHRPRQFPMVLLTQKTLLSLNLAPLLALHAPAPRLCPQCPQSPIWGCRPWGSNLHRSKPTTGFIPFYLMWLNRHRGRELEELLPVTAATWAFNPIQKMLWPFKGHLKSMGREGLNCKIAIKTDNYHVGMCFLQERVVRTHFKKKKKGRTRRCSFICI